MRVLLTESASLTARETLTALGRAGHSADLLSSGPGSVGSFSRWRHRLVRVRPAVHEDPVGWVRSVGRLLADGHWDAVLPTHEQSWLLALGRSALPAAAPIPLASAAAFDQVQGKQAFVRLADRLGLPQPRWWLAGESPPPDARCWWVKADHATAGLGVARAASAAQTRAAAAEFGPDAICQEHVEGRYGQAQGVFARGRLVAAHCSVGAFEGIGGSASARLSVAFPDLVAALSAIGESLQWHGGLTLDFVDGPDGPRLIECNPRQVEPGNAVAAGADLVGRLIAVGRGETSGELVLGRPGVRTRSTLAMALGAAERGGRRAALAALAEARAYGAEVLTPVFADPPSLLPAAVSVGTAVLAPSRAKSLAGDVVRRYRVTAEQARLVRAALL